MLSKLISSNSSKLNLMKSFSTTTSTTTPTPGTKIFTLQYFFVPNMPERRAPFRQAHLKYLNDLVSEGKFIAGGAYQPTCEEGLLVYRSQTKEEVEQYAKNDPYYLNNLVVDYKINEWNVVVGKL